MQSTNKNSSSPKNVLLLAQTIATGGLESQMFAHAKTLKKLGQWNPIVFAYESADQQSYLKQMYENEGIEVIIIDKGPGFSVRTIFNIIKICKKKNIKIVHSNDIGPLVYAGMSKIFSFGRLSVIHTQHSFLYVKDKFRYLMYIRFFSKVADVICTVSEHMVKDFQKLGVDEKKISSIPNGTDFLDHYVKSKSEKESFRNQLYSELPNRDLVNALKSKKNWLICLGRVAPEKGQPLLIKIWEKINLEIKKDWLLVLVGPDITNLYSEKKRNELLAIDVALCGPTNKAQIWYSSANLFATASSFEGAPLAPIEAMAMNLPILLSDIEGHQKLASWGTVFSIQNIDQAAQVIGHRMKQESVKSDLDNIAETVRHEFSLEKMSSSYQDLYLQIDN